MCKGITHSCANVWRAIARAGGWFCAQRAAKDWEGVYEREEIAGHLNTLNRGGFLEAKHTRREGVVYAYTVACKPLPGETLLPVTPAASDPGYEAQPAAPRRIDLMNSTYEPTPWLHRS
jgi:hypothetical protein